MPQVDLPKMGNQVDESGWTFTCSVNQVPTDPILISLCIKPDDSSRVHQNDVTF